MFSMCHLQTCPLPGPALQETKPEADATQPGETGDPDGEAVVVLQREGLPPYHLLVWTVFQEPGGDVLELNVLDGKTTFSLVPQYTETETLKLSTPFFFA